MLRTAAPLFVVLIAAMVTMAHSQTVSNGSFEDKDASLNRPMHWHHNARNATEYVEMAWDDAIAHSGQFSVSIGFPEDFPKEKDNVAWMWVTTVDGFTVGETYELTAWIKTLELGFTPTILVQFRDADDTFLSRAETHEEYPITGTTDWTQVKTTFRIPEKTAHVKLRATLKATQNAGGTVWFDDIAISKVVE